MERRWECESVILCRKQRPGSDIAFVQIGPGFFGNYRKLCNIIKLYVKNAMQNNFKFIMGIKNYMLMQRNDV